MCPSFSQPIFKKEIRSLFWGHRINWASCSSVYLSRTSLMTQCGITSLTSLMWQPSCSFLAWYTGSSHRPLFSQCPPIPLVVFSTLYVIINPCITFLPVVWKGRRQYSQPVVSVVFWRSSRWCRDRNMALCPIAFKNAYIFTGLIFISCRNRQSWTLRCYKKMETFSWC